MKIFLKILKSLFFGGLALILVTVGIDAADNYDNMSASIIGRIMFNDSGEPCPEGMTFVSSDKSGFCIDEYEASPGDACPNVEVNSQLDTRDNLDLKNCIPVSVPGAKPWRFISQSQAISACAKAGKRLANNAEWYYASLGTPDIESGWGSDDCQVSNNWDSQPGLTGSGKNCVSYAGAYDMIGNVWEWVMGEINNGEHENIALPEQGYISSTNIVGIPLATSEIQDPNYNEDYLWIKDSGIRGFARGGYWNNEKEAGLYSIYLVSPPSFSGAGVGFRCVKDL